MVKSGLIVGGISFVLIVITSFVSQLFCAPCLSLLAGLAAGYLGGLFDRPFNQGNSVKVGAGAGAISGGVALVGNLAGGLLNAAVLGPERAADMMRGLGLDIGQSPDVGTYFASSTVFACCIGVFDVLLMAGLGALGGLLWYQIVGQKGTAGTPPAPTMPA